MNDLAIEATGLVKTYGGVNAVDSLDLSVERGTVVALLGPNGAGKTTTVQMLATLTALDGGRATVCGHDVVTEPDAVRRSISLTGQFAALEDNLSAQENLMLMAQLRGYRRAAAKQVVGELIDRFDIGSFRDRVVKTLSGGQRRRVDLAASLVVRPELLVLDEPTTGLDPRSRQVVWSTVRDLVADGITLLLTTQYLDEADALAQHIVLIDHGRATASGTPLQLKTLIGDLRVDITTAVGSDVELLRTALDTDYEVTVDVGRRLLSVPAPRESADLARVADLVSRSGIAVEELALRRPSLDDAFLALTTDSTPSGGAA